MTSSSRSAREIRRNPVVVGDRTVKSPGVLVIAWRRPQHVVRVLDALSRWKPERLFLACDGWNADTDPDTVDAIKSTRLILDRHPSWPCSVERRYFEGNLGVDVGVPAAVDWFLDSCEEGIILEDDCVPTAGFLNFASDLLVRYREEPRVMAILGDNSRGIRIAETNSYSFVRYPSPWGWATWARAWRQYDPAAGRASSLSGEDWKQLLPDPVERRVWQERAEWFAARSGPKFWDMRWALSIVSSGGLVVQPRINLIENIGFGDGATHTVDAPHGLRPPGVQRGPLAHPAQIVVDEVASRDLFDRVLGGQVERRRLAWEQTLWGRLRLAIHRRLARRLPAGFRSRLESLRTRSPWAP